MKNNTVKNIALGGMLAATAMVVMFLGGLIPVATFVCPMLCVLLLHIVFGICGRRIAWAWYVAVSILSLLLSPDREAACVFLMIGYYPIVKPALDRSRFRWFWKLLLFNASVLVLYSVLLSVLGIYDIAEDYKELGIAGLCILWVLGNLTFLLLDRLLTILSRKRKKRPGFSNG